MWRRAGCPRVAHGKWDLREVYLWHKTHIEGIDDEAENLQAARRKYWNFKAQREEIAVKQLKQKLFAKEDISRLWVSRILAVKSGLLSLSDRLAALLVGKSQKEISSILDRL